MRPGKVKQAQNLMDRIPVHSARMKDTAMIGRFPTNLMVCLHTHFSILVPRVRVPFPSEVDNNSTVGKKAPKEAETFVLLFFLPSLLFRMSVFGDCVALASLEFVVFFPCICLLHAEIMSMYHHPQLRRRIFLANASRFDPWLAAETIGALFMKSLTL